MDQFRHLVAQHVRLLRTAQPSPTDGSLPKADTPGIYGKDAESEATLVPMPLPKLERNTIYKAIAKSKLEPAEFSISENRQTVTLTHEDSGAIFKIVWRSENFTVGVARIIYQVPDGGNHDQTPYDKLYSMNTAASLITQWANEIKLTTEAPDLWASLEPRKNLIADIQEQDSNTAFKVDEQRLITAQLLEIKNQLKSQFELTSEQVARIEEELDEAAEASKRMGRKDWFIYFIGVISSLTIAATVAPGVGEHIFTMFMQALGYLFTGGGPPELMS